MKTSKKGISLIVLVITIIVMIVLAAAIILSLQGSGIIGRANEAKIKTDVANAKQVVAMANAEWQLDEAKIRTENPGITTFKQYAESKLTAAGYKVSGEGSYEVTEEGIIYPYPVIPEGFVVSQIAGESKVSEGLVVYEIPTGTTVNWTATSEKDTSMLDVQEKYNQYVWIPVNNINEFKVKDWGKGITGDSFKNNISELYSGLTVADETGEIAEYNKMRASVEKNGGFYIARYEAGLPEGKTTSNVTTGDLPVSKKGADVWNNIAWGTNMTTIGTTRAVYYSREMYKGSNSVVSTLCYGVQWDAAINFIKDVPNVKDVSKKYIEDSTDMGWYLNNYSSGNSNHNTGKDLNIDTNSDGTADLFSTNKVKNIYDMAGNVYEWTMEADSAGFRVCRGGSFVRSGSSYPASDRYHISPGIANDYCGFRPALYLK